MEYTALIVGYAVIGILVLMILYLFIQWALYGEIGQSVSVKIDGGNVYVNNELVIVGNAGGNITSINGSVYSNGHLIYKHKRKFRWEK